LINPQMSWCECFWQKCLIKEHIWAWILIQIMVQFSGAREVWQKIRLFWFQLAHKFDWNLTNLILFTRKIFNFEIQKLSHFNALLVHTRRVTLVTSNKWQLWFCHIQYRKCLGNNWTRICHKEGPWKTFYIMEKQRLAFNFLTLHADLSLKAIRVRSNCSCPIVANSSTSGPHDEYKIFTYAQHRTDCKLLEITCIDCYGLVDRKAAKRRRLLRALSCELPKCGLRIFFFLGHAGEYKLNRIILCLISNECAWSPYIELALTNLANDSS